MAAAYLWSVGSWVAHEQPAFFLHHALSPPVAFSLVAVFGGAIAVIMCGLWVRARAPVLGAAVTATGLALVVRGSGIFSSRELQLITDDGEPYSGGSFFGTEGSFFGTEEISLDTEWSVVVLGSIIVLASLVTGRVLGSRSEADLWDRANAANSCMLFITIVAVSVSVLGMELASEPLEFAT